MQVCGVTFGAFCVSCVFLHILVRFGEAPHNGFISTFEGYRASMAKVDNVTITVHVSQRLDQIIEELLPAWCLLPYSRPNFQVHESRDPHQGHEVP